MTTTVREPIPMDDEGLIDAKHYGEAIVALRETATWLATPLLANGVDLHTVRTTIGQIVQAGVHDAWMSR